MTRARPATEWWTPQALAESGLPDIPGTRRGVDQMAIRLGWRDHPTLARKRSGRGGGWEFNWQLLPGPAQKMLLAAADKPAPARPDRGDIWAYFEGLPEAAKEVARARLAAIRQIEALEASLGRHQAVAHAAEAAGVGVRTVWAWLALIDGVDAADRLAYLAPRHRLQRTDADPAAAGAFFDLLKGDYLRLEAPSFAASYAVALRIAEARGLEIMQERTARRQMDKIPQVVRVFAREGERGLARCFPPQTRDRTQMVAMEGVNADCHKFDVFVIWPDEDKPRRAQLVAFQDIYSGKVLSWRIDRDPNKVAVMSAFGELIETYGIPRHCLFDNGMEFANKWLTGGTKTRFRFTVRPDDPLGVLPQLGIQIHWAKPAHGQAKPVERAFRDMADRIAKDARFAGAYVGNRPDAKPENYMSRAIPLDEFVAVVADGIEQHNARAGRQSATCRGRSFDATFAASYAQAPIRKATDSQRRLWLMGQEVRRAHSTHGQISLHEAEYWSDWMSEIAGQKIIARFDPENLNAGVEVYALSGEYLGFAETKQKTPFFNLAAAQEAAALERRRKRLAKAALEAARPVTVTHIAAELNALDRESTTPAESKVVEMVQRGRGPVINRPAPTPITADGDADRQDALVVKFRQQAAARAAEAEDTDVARWHRACAIEARLAADEPVGSAEAEWLYGYQDTPEYRRQKRMVEQFGPAAIG
ncbi:MAG: transposase domain-containing protein [Paracoccus sp. (in: a-proteobacteria)]|nr:transposase domain-containing protein [Paracoccus sp. (in: a-proteobacteria)]